MADGGEPQPLYAVTKEDNPEVMAVCYAQGWAADENFLTFEEAAAITDVGTAFRNHSEITHFKEFKYFINVTKIKTNAFQSCSGLKSISIPARVTVIEGFGCYNSPLEYLYFPPNIIEFQGNPGTNFSNNKYPFELHIDDFEAYCKSTGNSCSALFNNQLNGRDTRFYLRGRELTGDIVIPSGVTALRRNLFARMEYVSSFKIPDTVVTVGQDAFSYVGAGIIDLGNGVQTIEQSGISNCRRCHTFISRAMTAPTLGSNAFQYMGYSVQGTTKRLVVPRGSTGYDADQWKTTLQDTKGLDGKSFILTYLDEYE